MNSHRPGTWLLCLLLMMLLPLSPLATNLVHARDDRELQSFLEKVRSRSDKIKTLSCKLIQERHLALFSKPVIFEGRLAVVRPRKLRWQFTTPVPSLLLLDDEKGLRCNDDTPPVRFDLQTDPIMRMVAEQLWTWLDNDYTKLDQQYRLTLSNDSSLLIEPKETTVAEVIAAIRISFHPENLQPERVEITEPGGDRTIITFRDFQLDLPLADSLFNQCSDE